MPRRRSGKKIDFLHWTPGSFSFGSQGAGASGVTVQAAQHLPETLMRTRGSWSCKLEGTQTGGQGVLVSIGTILVPEGTGTTVLWSPFTDGDAPWIWYDSMVLFYEEYVTDVIWSSNVTDGMRVIDSKSMRVNKNMELQCVVENTTLLTAASISAGGGLRTLYGT